MDSVDKYRHGVLIGNFVEDKFGKDLDEKVITINYSGSLSRCAETCHYKRSSRYLPFFV